MRTASRVNRGGRCRPCGFSSALAHASLCIMQKKQTCSIEGHWRRRRERKKRETLASAPYNEVRAQFSEQEAASGEQQRSEPFGHFMKRTGLPLFLFHHLWHASVSPSLPGAIPAAILSGGDPRPPRKPSWSPLGFRTETEERRGGGKMKKREKACRLSLPLSSDGCVNRPTAASAPPQLRQWSNGGRAEGASRIECSHFRSCVKNSHHSVASDIRGKLVQWHGRPKGRVSKRRNMLDAVAMVTLHFFPLLVVV